MNDDWSKSYQYSNTPPRQPDFRAAMSSTAMALGIASIVLSMSGTISLVLGGIGIMMAVITRDRAQQMLPAARRALLFALIGIVVSYCIMISNIYTVLTNPELQSQINELLMNNYGISFDEIIGTMKESVGLFSVR